MNKTSNDPDTEKIRNALGAVDNDDAVRIVRRLVESTGTMGASLKREEERAEAFEYAAHYWWNAYQKDVRRRMRTEVSNFAEAMEAKLSQKDVERGGNSWKRADVDTLYRHLADELVKLRSAIKEGDEIHARAEAVDVANFALMLWDVCR